MGTGFRDIVAPSSSTGIGCLIRSYRARSGQVPPCPPDTASVTASAPAA
jgi:hypothetical protein